MMTIKQDFRRLVLYTVIMLFALTVVGTYEPVLRSFCFSLAGVVIVMFIYMGRIFIDTETRALDKTDRPRQEKKRSSAAKQFINDNWDEEELGEEDEME